jgi:hypothetical protein
VASRLAAKRCLISFLLDLERIAVFKSDDLQAINDRGERRVTGQNRGGLQAAPGRAVLVEPVSA